MPYKISVVMASYLYEYDYSAKDRVRKFERAVYSFNTQNYSNKELIIVSDGCDITAKETMKFNGHEIKLVVSDKKPLFSGQIRHLGCQKATGDIICYLDTDDYLGANHLNRINECFEYYPDINWICYDDYVVYIINPVTREVIAKEKRRVDLKKGMVGTSSIAHKNLSEFSWYGCDGYGHDWDFISRIINSNKRGKIIHDGFEHYVCHIPNSVDS